MKNHHAFKAKKSDDYTLFDDRLAYGNKKQIINT
jgi:hypothetical protein